VGHLKILLRLILSLLETDSMDFDPIVDVVVFSANIESPTNEGTEIASAAGMAKREIRDALICYLCKYYGYNLSFIQFSILKHFSTSQC
jgi:hypothetical protein